MHLVEYGKIVSGWTAVNVYHYIIHGPSEKTIEELREGLPKLHADARSKPGPTERPLSYAKKARSMDSASGIRLYFDNPNKGVDAQAIYSSEGFLVLAGSSGPREVKKYFTSANRVRRGNLIDRGEIEFRGDRLYFVHDVLFNSPSTAAELVSGASQNGRVVWKDKNGKTLKEIQQGSS
ncbi:MAG: DUF4357 domain-containing protein [Ectothiorhodospiraceae bacterium AqS1]|nr:DUF4357 domain-containing protein [Ectothiorhodospiraceae bacterium AqS1]